MADSAIEYVRQIVKEAVKAVSVEDLAGREVKLVRAGMERRGPCPLCGAGSKSASGPFAVNPVKGTWRTYCCEKHGDVVDLERELRGGTMLEAAQRLVGGGYTAPSVQPKRKAEAPTGPTASDRLAKELWRDAAVKLRGTLAEGYLRKRGLDGPVLDAVLDCPNLRYHPNAKWGWDAEARDWIRAPAIIGSVCTWSGPTGGVHATYLSRSASKAELTPAKKMWGQQHDPAGLPGGVWLIGPDGEGDLVVGEGIESSLSLAMLEHRRTGRLARVAAALSLGRLQGRMLRDDDGCVDVVDPKADPSGPAFIWPAPPASPWPSVLIAIDRDMAPVRIMGRNGRGKPVEFQLDGEGRARVCARLSVAWWRFAGAATVKSIAPPPGSDFNSELLRVLREAR